MAPGLGKSPPVARANDPSRDCCPDVLLQLITRYYQKLQTDLMKTMQLLFRLLVVLLFFVTACGDKEDAPKPPSRTGILTAKAWKMNKLLKNEIDVTDDPSLLQFKAMQFEFKADGSYTLTSLLGTQTGTWAFSENDSKVILDPNTTDAQTLEIVELKDSSLKFRTANEIPPLGQQMIILELVPA
jgi:hypothetical protein